MQGAFYLEMCVKMPKDDIFRLIYTILKELYEHKKEGTQTPLEDIGPDRLCIPVPSGDFAAGCFLAGSRVGGNLALPTPEMLVTAAGKSFGKNPLCN